jgi:DNA-binding transcriptional ArsR family regulator
VIRKLLLVFLGAAAICLVPWTVYLAQTLPDRHDSGQWRVAWVGFDVALACCFAGAAWLGLRRRRAAVPLLTATAALLFCDAWFDVLLDWNSSDRWLSVGLAVFAELPIAVFLLVAARRLLTGKMRRRALTVRDIEVYDNPQYQQVMRSLPATVPDLASRTGLSTDDVVGHLETLARDGFVRRRRDGRWHAVAQYLRETRPEEFGEPHRTRVAEYLDQTYDRELELLSWAAKHRTEFGPWGKAQRASARLTELELREFEAEYLELLTRYVRLRGQPARGARSVGGRFFAFPAPEAT